MKLNIYDKQLSYSFYENGGTYLVILQHGTTAMMIDVQIEDNFCKGLVLECRYRERWYAIGKTPPNFYKKDDKSKPYEDYISSLIHKTVYQAIDQKLNCKLQITCKVISYEQGSPLESLAINVVNVALRAAGVPCAVMGAVQSSFVKEWNLGNFGDKRMIACGDQFNVNIIEGHNIDLAHLKDGIHYSYTQIKNIVAFNANSLQKIKIKKMNDACHHSLPTISIKPYM